MLIKAKKVSVGATIPTRKRDSDAGWDLSSLERERITGNSVKLVRTGIALEIPTGYYGLLRARSGFAVDFQMGVTAGVIDSEYRGEVRIAVMNPTQRPFTIEPGERIAQIIITKLPSTEMKEVTELGESDRGEKGFGSSGK